MKLDRSVEDPQFQSETDEFGDFESIWRGIQAETANARSLVEDDTFVDNMDIRDYGDMDEWRDFDGLNTLGGQSSRASDSTCLSSSNPFQDMAQIRSPKGLRIMDSGGNLSAGSPRL